MMVANIGTEQENLGLTLVKKIRYKKRVSLVFDVNLIKEKWMVGDFGHNSHMFALCLQYRCCSVVNS